MANPPPTIYYLYGTDEFAISEFVEDRILTRIGQDTTAEMNITRFDASNFEVHSLEETCKSLPFLTDRRIVILQNASRLPDTEDFRSSFLSILDQIPATTALIILYVHDGSKNATKKAANSPFLKWANDHPSKSYIKEFILPKGARFTDWIMARATSEGGRISPEAAQLLSAYVLEDPRLADMELHKLLDYVDRSRGIELSDVERLTPFSGQADVFGLVDAIGKRDAQLAQMLLDQLIKEDDASYAFAMIARQVRLLTIVRDCLDRNTNPEEALGRLSFLASRLRVQASNFSLSDLNRLYAALYDMDVATKRGTLDLETSLEILVASLSNADTLSILARSDPY